MQWREAEEGAAHIPDRPSTEETQLLRDKAFPHLMTGLPTLESLGITPQDLGVRRYGELSALASPDLACTVACVTRLQPLQHGCTSRWASTRHDCTALRNTDQRTAWPHCAAQH